ncbi:UNKNOWN [Stylonychia lemnae]|uniref:Transmembrane protein n=1 Tax=Stylonychia lemnae TaxID=5949 RepID=A0A078B1P1_STYLE|nr:UNKNOWN [Stylonychia lemnae]|eukprot:CDW88414.1 UNKNOWN [Stylonychia lemnae]
MNLTDILKIDLKQIKKDQRESCSLQTSDNINLDLKPSPAKNVWIERVEDRYYVMYNVVLYFEDFNYVSDIPTKEIMIFCQGSPYKECYQGEKFVCIEIGSNLELTYLDYYYDNHKINDAIALEFKQSSGWGERTDLLFTPFYLNKSEQVVQISEKYYQEDYFSIFKDEQEKFDQNSDAKYVQAVFYIKKSQQAFEVITIIPKQLGQALGQIGGYFSLFGAVLFLLKVLHMSYMKRDLRKMINEENLRKKSSIMLQYGNDQCFSVHQESIENMFSFENFHKVNQIKFHISSGYS